MEGWLAYHALRAIGQREECENQIKAASDHNKHAPKPIEMGARKLQLGMDENRHSSIPVIRDACEQWLQWQNHREHWNNM